MFLTRYEKNFFKIIECVLMFIIHYFVKTY